MAIMEEKSPCPLCLHSDNELFYRDSYGSYLHCRYCDGVFMEQQWLPDPATERKRYLEHNNSPGDSGYIQFLERISVPVLESMHPGSCGLDYGCGPVPVLSSMLQEGGMEISSYDPFFFPANDALEMEGAYDFIVCCETAEHFHKPAKEFSRLAALLKPGGKLFIMTSILHGEIYFPTWYYRNDLTHVFFYSEKTFPVKNVIVLEKN